jgi:hypothetical protein
MAEGLLPARSQVNQLQTEPVLRSQAATWGDEPYEDRTQINLLEIRSERSFALKCNVVNKESILSAAIYLPLRSQDFGRDCCAIWRLGSGTWLDQLANPGSVSRCRERHRYL